ncbi:MAG TPA: MFS transporter [Anaerolineales bacterium]|nr:MFS transporter [Anaerolineales bacterium]HNB40284.1 MFS transporter [Anaerolineales bacterium]HNE03102.1 MFS transporter [Anaerolineales bacterium]HNO92948.1 MFS transporter [Anaerolineales bacterium]
MSRKLPFWLKTLYGSGDWGIASISMMRSIFYAIYLTDVVGIEPRLASLGALVGIVWDAVNDPIIGMLSDRVKSKLGRRRPFLLWFAFPFGLSFVMLWSAPNWDSQVALLIYVTLAFMISDTLTTLVAVPYYSLTPELTQNYDERTSLSSFRSVFQLLSAMVVVVSAPMIVDAVISGGGTQQQGFLTAGAVFGAIGSLPLFLIGLFIRERFAEDTQEQEELSFRETLKLAWQNVPFRYAVGIYMFNWSAVDMVSITFPFFLLYWVAQGDLLAKINILGVDLALESAFFGVLMLVCVLFVPFWLWLSKRQNKIRAYILGMAAWVVVQVLIFTIQPGETSYMLFLAGLAGIGVSAAYILPDSILPDVIEWDELRTGRRQEGIYYGIRTLIRKLTGALIIFITLQILGWSGYQAPPENVTVYQQPESALFMIRLMDSFIGAAILAGTIILAWSYPLTREKYQKIQKLLAVRRNKNAETT